MLFDKLKKLWDRIRRGEFLYLAHLATPAGNPIFYFDIQLIFRLVDTEKFENLYQMVAKRCDHELIIADASLLSRLCDQFPDQASKFRRRAEEDKHCFVALHKGRITAYLWALEVKEIFKTNSLWSFVPDEIDGPWFFDGYVMPEYRLQGLFLYLMGGARNAFLSRGYTTQYGETDYRNTSSLNTHLRVGYEVIWRVPLVSVLGLKIYFPKSEVTGRRHIAFRYALKIKSRVL